MGSPRPRRVLAAVLCLLLTGSLGGAMAAATPRDGDGPPDEAASKITFPDHDPLSGQTVPDRWLVELASPAVADGGSQTVVQAEQAELVEAVEEAGGEVTTEYGELWNGAAVSAGSEDLEEIAALDEVVSIRPVTVIEALDEPEVSGAEPSTVSSTEMIGADIAQSALGYTGSGMRIGIIDSGIDYDLEELGGAGTPGPRTPTGDGSTSFPNTKVIAGYDFVGDAYTGYTTPQPDAFPDDCSGHGTHVAGIAAGGGQEGTEQIRGVAPDATLASYRVFGCVGRGSDDVIIAALERAAADDMDVVNMSLGLPYGVWSDSPLATAADNLAAQGIVVIASQANAGRGFPWGTGSAAAAQHVIAVGSVDNAVTQAPYLTVSSAPGQQFAYAPALSPAVSITPDDSAQFPLVAAGDPAADGADEPSDPSVLCEPRADGSLTGTVVLVAWGACGTTDKVRHAQDSGAHAVIIQEEGPASGITVDEQVTTTPAVGIGNTDAAAIRASLTDGATVTFAEGTVDVPVQTAGLVSWFSSSGPNASLELKPDVVAPGGNIWSAVPIEHGARGLNSGTSMASPHVAGAAALILQAHPELAAAQDLSAYNGVAWRLRSTAVPVAWGDAGEDTSLLEPVTHQGAGLVAVDRAITATTEPAPSVLNLGESAAHPQGVSQTVTLTNHSSTMVTYELSHADAIMVPGDAFATKEATTGHSTVSTDSTTVSVPAHGTVEVPVTISAPEGIADGRLYGGWLIATPTVGADADELVRIPFMGVGGDLSRVAVIGSHTAILDEDHIPVDTSTYVFGDSVRSTEGVYLDHPVLREDLRVPYTQTEIELLSVEADGSTRRLGIVPGLFTWTEPMTWATLTWDGSYIDEEWTQRQAPSGRYQLVLRVLPVGADGRGEDDWVEWTSPTITIDWKTEGYIPQAELTVVSPSDAPELVDDDVFTFAAPGQSSWDIDLGVMSEVTAVHLTPHQYNWLDRAQEWTAWTSTDGEHWVPAGQGSVAALQTAPSVITLATAVTARYVRVELAQDPSGAGVPLGVSEIRVAGQPSAESTDSPSPVPGTGESESTAGPTAESAGGSTRGTAPVLVVTEGSSARPGALPVASTLRPGDRGPLARTGASAGHLAQALGCLVVGTVVLVAVRRRDRVTRR